jgi:predicted ester cyclase
MDRRQAIKITTMLFGGAASGTTLAGMLSACQQADTGAAGGTGDDQAARIEAAKNVLRTLFDDVLTNNQLDLIDELYDPEYEFVVPKLAGMTSNVVQGRDKFRQRVVAFRTAFPDVIYRIQDIVSDGEIVATSFAFTGTHAGAFAGFEPTNQESTITGVHFAKLVDGRIRKTWAGFTNIAEALTPATDEGAE